MQNNKSIIFIMISFLFLFSNCVKAAPSTANFEKWASKYETATPIPTPTREPTNCKIAVAHYDHASKNSDIILLYGGGYSENLTKSGTINETQPDWSPDGKKIVFVSAKKDDFASLHFGHICIMNADGSNTQKFSEYGSTPVWSPDGKKIAFVSNNHIFIMDADGKNSARISLSKEFEDRDPDWSPDGTKIVFSSSRYDADGNYIDGIFIMNLIGVGEHISATGVDKYLGRGTKPTWSPDGKKIAFIGRRGGDSRDFIYVMNSNGSNVKRLSDRWAGYLDWSPNGKYIVADTTQIPLEGEEDEYYPINSGLEGQDSSPKINPLCK